MTQYADPSARAVSGVVLWPLARWDCGFESRREHEYQFRVSVVCCQAEVSAMSVIENPHTEGLGSLEL